MVVVVVGHRVRAHAIVVVGHCVRAHGMVVVAVEGQYVGGSRGRGGGGGVVHGDQQAGQKQVPHSKRCSSTCSLTQR